MFRTWFSPATVVLLYGVAAAQEASPPVAPTPAPSATARRPSDPDAVDVNAAADDRAEYMIEMKLLEGKGIFSEDSTRSNATAGYSALELLRKSTSPWEKTLGVGAAPHPILPPATIRGRNRDGRNATTVPPSAMSAPPIPVGASMSAAAHPSSTAKDSEEDELWESSTVDLPGIATLAAPRVVSRTSQSVTFMIQTSRHFSYLEPLGDDKYQAKRILANELGMKITLAVQPVAGDETGVELSPLEIQITALDGREPVEGLDLDVGKPIISTRSLKTTAKMKLGATRLIAIPSGPKTQAALLLRVQRAPTGLRDESPKLAPGGASAEAASGGISGIGAALGIEDDDIVIMQILPDSPAALHKAIKVGDRLMAVAQGLNAPVATKGLMLADAVALIRGPDGTMVRLTVLSPGEHESQARVVTMVRGELKGVSKDRVMKRVLPGAGDGVLLAPGSKAPNIEMTSLDEPKLEHLADFAGQIVVLNFWATWCSPCWKIMAEMQTYADKHPEWKGKVVLIAASVDEDGEIVRKYLRMHGWNKTHNVRIGAEATRAFHVDAVSTDYVIDQQGRIVAAGSGLDFPRIVNSLIHEK